MIIVIMHNTLPSVLTSCTGYCTNLSVLTDFFTNSHAAWMVQLCDNWLASLPGGWRPWIYPSRVQRPRQPPNSFWALLHHPCSDPLPDPEQRLGIAEDSTANQVSLTSSLFFRNVLLLCKIELLFRQNVVLFLPKKIRLRSSHTNVVGAHKFVCVSEAT